MSRTVGRFVLICLFLAAALFVAYRFALRTQMLQQDLFERAATARMAQAAPRPAPLDGITYRPCTASDCVLVQAAGRNFLVGAGEGAAQSLFLMGALNADLDGVLLTELSRDQVEGLLGVRDRTLEAGRRDMLNVYGPSGVERVVEGVNAMLETSDADRAVRYSEGLLPFAAAPVIAAEMGLYEDGAIVFDSGVLTIRSYNAFSGRAGSDALVYRFDYQGRALVVASCRARLDDIRKAYDDHPVEEWALILPLASEELLNVLRDKADAAGLGRKSRFLSAAGDECLSISAFEEATASLDPSATIAWPLHPAPSSAIDQRLWESLTEQISTDGRFFSVGRPGGAYTLRGGPKD